MAMEKAWSILEELGAVDEGGKLTPLGRHMVCETITFTPVKLTIMCTVNATYRSSTRKGFNL